MKTTCKRHFYAYDMATGCPDCNAMPKAVEATNVRPFPSTLVELEKAMKTWPIEDLRNVMDAQFGSDWHDYSVDQMQDVLVNHFGKEQFLDLFGKNALTKNGMTDDDSGLIT